MTHITKETLLLIDYFCYKWQLGAIITDEDGVWYEEEIIIHNHFCEVVADDIKHNHSDARVEAIKVFKTHDKPLTITSQLTMRPNLILLPLNFINKYVFIGYYLDKHRDNKNIQVWTEHLHLIPELTEEAVNQMLNELTMLSTIIFELENKKQPGSINNEGTMPILSTLTEREKEIYDYLVDNATNKEISDKLGISINTVKNHVQSILTKLNVPSRRHLIAINKPVI